jgi:propionyl-CoA synthetase
MGFVVLKEGETIDPQALEAALKATIREQIGAIANLQAVAVVDKLPKTRSGKILRKSIRQLTREPDVPVPATIEDPTSLETIRDALEAAGVGQYAD